MVTEYIKMRNSNTVDLQLLYTIAVSRGMKLSPSEFMMGVGYLNMPELIKNLDKDFDLTVLLDKEGNFIKVIE